MSAYQHQSKFDGENEKAWLCRIATNKCVDYQRAAARRVIPMLEEEIPWDFTGEQNGPLQTVLNQEVLEELRTCCQALGPPYHEIARLHFLEGKTAKEISELLGENLHTVQTWIYRARQKLKKSLRKEWLKE